MPDKEKEIVIIQSGSINTNNTNSGSLSVLSTDFTGTVEAKIFSEGEVEGITTLTGTLGALVDDDSFSGSINASDIHDGATTGTLTLRIGQDGQDGKDGFSPTITVHKDTKTEYVLKVTNKDGSYLTPNLYPQIEGLQDVVELVRGKVDKDLSDYPEVQLSHYNPQQREQSFFYLNTYDNKAKKVSAGSIALVSEVDDRLRTKIRTVKERPSNDWRLGDYIFLDLNQEDGE